MLNINLFNFRKVLLFIVCLIPIALLIFNFFTDNLTAEPVEFMLESTGIWVLRFLLITLSITTIRKLFSINLIKYRRMVGLFAFFYMVLHFLIYLVFEHSFEVSDIFKEIITKKHIFVGFLALLLFIPLVITSTKNWMKKLKKNWAKLHKLTYLIVCLGLLHFIWTVKSDITEPVIYVILFTLTLFLRKFKINKVN